MVRALLTTWAGERMKLQLSCSLITITHIGSQKEIQFIGTTVRSLASLLTVRNIPGHFSSQPLWCWKINESRSVFGAHSIPTDVCVCVCVLPCTSSVYQITSITLKKHCQSVSVHLDVSVRNTRSGFGLLVCSDDVFALLTNTISCCLAHHMESDIIGWFSTWVIKNHIKQEGSSFSVFPLQL